VEEDPDKDEQPLIPLMEENLPVIQWWMSIPSFLRWNGSVCLGMDVIAVKSDAELSGRNTHPAEYAKLKLIARTLTEELNQREQ